MRVTATIALLLSLLFAVSAAGAPPRLETVSLMLLKPMDGHQLEKLESDLRAFKAFRGVTWDLPSARCNVNIDTGLSCKEDLVAFLNARTPDHQPIVAVFDPPDPKETMKEVLTILARMEESFKKERQPKALLPDIALLGPKIQLLADYARKVDPPKDNSRPGPLFEKARLLSIRVYVLQSVAKREYTDTTEKSLGELRVSSEEMAAALGMGDPQPPTNQESGPAR